MSPKCPSVFNRVLLEFLFEKKVKMFITDPFFQTFVIIVKSKLTPGHNIVKFSGRFTRLGLVHVDPQHFYNVMMLFYHQ